MTALVEVLQATRMNVVDGLFTEDQFGKAGYQQFAVKTATLRTVNMNDPDLSVAGQYYTDPDELTCKEQRLAPPGLVRPEAWNKIEHFIKVLIGIYDSANATAMVLVIWANQ